MGLISQAMDADIPKSEVGGDDVEGRDSRWVGGEVTHYFALDKRV